MPIEPLRRSNLPQAIAAELRARIERGELAPGDRLPGHRELAASFSVSVGSVREAISMLISAGLVVTRAGRGTFVAAAGARTAPPLPGRPLQRKEVEELIEAREVLELQLAAMAAERASAEQIAKLRACVARLGAAAADPDEYPEADVEFHLALAEAAGNRFLLRAMQDIRALLKRDMELSAEAAIRRFGHLEFSVASHAALVDAVEAGDTEEARRILFDTMSRNHEFVLGLYALAPPAPAIRS